MESIVSEQVDQEKAVDREKTCPLLLRVFCNTGRHNTASDYARGNTPANELQIYTWLDASLKELTSLIKEVNLDARKRGTLFDFAMVYPDVRTSGYNMKDIGTTCANQKGADDNVSLQSKRFVIGDYVDVAITPPRGPPMMMAPPGRRGMRPY